MDRKLLVVVALVTACSGVNTPVAPVAVDNTVTPTAPPPPPPVVPGVTAPAGTYVFVDTGTTVAFYTRRSRFVLGDEGRFSLQYEGLSDYRGKYTYSHATGIVTFTWDGWSTAGPWEAVGFLQDDVMTVAYNTVMQLTDFESATYRRLPND